MATSAHLKLYYFGVVHYSFHVAVYMLNVRINNFVTMYINSMYLFLLNTPLFIINFYSGFREKFDP